MPSMPNVAGVRSARVGSELSISQAKQICFLTKVACFGDVIGDPEKSDTS